MYANHTKQRDFRLFVDAQLCSYRVKRGVIGCADGDGILAVRPARIGRIPGLSSAIGKNGAVAGSKSTPGEISRTFEPAPQALSLTRTNQWECQSATSIAGSPS